MEITGKVVRILPQQNISDKFSKREVVIETDEQYPQKLAIEFHNKNIDNLANILEGENVKIGINLRGREWTSPQGETKVFNTIVGWYIDNVTEGSFDPEKQAKKSNKKLGNIEANFIEDAINHLNNELEDEMGDGLPF